MSELAYADFSGLSPAPIRRALLLVSKRAAKQVDPLGAVGIETDVIIGSKWSIAPKVFAQEDAIKSAGIDVVIADCCGTHATMAMMLREILGIPAVYRMRGNMWDEYQDRLEGRNTLDERCLVGALRAYTNYNLVRLDAILPVAGHMAKAVHAELPDLRTPVMPVPIAVDPLPPPPEDLDAVRKRWAPDGRRIVASITNFRYWQKAAPMLEAAPALAEVLRERGLIWAIAGKGAFTDRFFSELEDCCPRDVWMRVGFISDPSSLLHAADAFIHLSRMDGMPNVVLEAQFCGCPVIANDHPAMAELVDHENTGLLVSQPADAAQQLERLLGDEALRKRLITTGREYVLGHHTNEAVGREFARALGLVKATFDRRR